MFFNLFRQPYLDAPTDGGGGEPLPNPAPASTDPTPTPEPSPEPAPSGGGEPAPAPEQPKIKVKYNHQEMELPYDEAVTHIQKGMNYEKGIERAKQEARDAYIAEQNYEWNGKKITTEAEYKQALIEKEAYDKYKAQGLPDEVVNELVESKRFREEFAAEKQTKAQEAKRNAEYTEFLEYFKQENGRDFNVSQDTIPQEVWALTAKGKTLSDAYAYHANKQMRTKITDLENKIKGIETNKQNANSSPGSLDGNPADGGVLTEETINAHANDTAWMMKNYAKVQEFYAKKKG